MKNTRKTDGRVAIDENYEDTIDENYEDTVTLGTKDDYLEFHVRATVYQLSNIDTASHTFKVETFLRLTLDVDEFDEEPEVIEFLCTSYQPSLEILNSAEGTEDEIVFQGAGEETGPEHHTVYYDFMVHVTCSNRFDLQNFPFDAQQLRVRMALKQKVLTRPRLHQISCHQSEHMQKGRRESVARWHRGLLAVQGVDAFNKSYQKKNDHATQMGAQPVLNKSIRLPKGQGSRAAMIGDVDPGGRDVTRLLPSAFDDGDIWWLENKVHLEAYLSDPNVSSAFNQYSNLDLVFDICRKPHSYVHSIMVPSAGLTTLAWLTTAFEVDELGDRCGITLTLLLTTVAFKLIVSDSIPPVSYLTVMDKYLYASSFFIYAMVIANYVAWLLDSTSVDVFMLLLLLLGWALYNLKVYYDFTLLNKLTRRNFIMEYTPGPEARQKLRFLPSKGMSDVRDNKNHHQARHSGCEAIPHNASLVIPLSGSPEHLLQ